MSSTSNTMLVTCWRPKRSWAAVSGEALEPALRVLDRPDDPRRRESVENLAEHAPVARLAEARMSDPSGWIRIRGRRRDRPARRRGAAAGRAAWPCRRRRRPRGRGRGQHPGPDRGALAAVRHAEDPQLAATGADRSGLRSASTISAVASVLPSSTTRTSIASGRRPRPGAPSRATSPRRGDSRTARRAPDRSVRPR